MSNKSVLVRYHVPDAPSTWFDGVVTGTDTLSGRVYVDFSAYNASEFNGWYDLSTLTVL